MADNEKLMADARAALGALKDITPMLEAYAASGPPAANKVSAPVGTAERFNAGAEDGFEKILDLRSNLMLHDNRTLNRMIGYQLQKGASEGMGVPLAAWAAGNPNVFQVMQQNEMVRKLLETSGGGALIRQDMEPLLYAAFVRRFPVWDRLSKVPSNGLVHSYNRWDSAPEAEFISELGQVPSGKGVYTRATTPIAIAAIKVGVSLKQSFVPQIGGGSEAREIEGGLTGLRKLLQRTVLSGNATVPGKVATDPEGLFDVDSFDGFRGSIPAANKYLHDPSNFTLAESFNNADSVLSVFGGQSSILIMDARDRTAWMNELQASVRYVLPNLPLIPGLPPVGGISLGNSGDVPILTVPGNEIGSYTFGGDTVRDAYFLDESTIDVPYLGSDMPTILDIPTGVDGTLSHTFILFQMCGLAVRVPNYLAALRIPV